MISSELERIEREIVDQSAMVDRLLTEIGKRIIGQKGMVERILIAILADGHVLLEGMPGLAKTLAVKTFAAAIDAKFSRIQFTPDLLPADLVGTLIYRKETGEFVPKLGPVFANLILADEINRAPAKVQSALLEAMEERQVTIGDATHQLPSPFLVFATQNPIEQEGTYPLPEAQRDRFLLKLRIDYPTREEEKLIIERIGSAVLPEIDKVLTPAHLLEMRQVAHRVRVDEKIERYILDLVFATRYPDQVRGLKDWAALFEYGASPRASLGLLAAARCHAFLRHRAYVTPEDIKAIGPDVLRHRIIPSYEAEAEEKTVEDLVKAVFDNVEVP
ncbi:MAG: MoxR family ATPase [Myxococcales bacterium]|nr:MoxR family ATPase [Myxococcales bacterium]